MSAAVKPVPTFNVANVLTGLRLALVPVFLLLLLHHDGESTSSRWWAALVFAVAMATDLVDGQIARRWGQVTDLGKIIDPIADKFLVGGALIGLSWLEEVSWWATGLILARELAVTLVRLAVVRRTVLPAGRGGKIKTALQGLALVMLVAPLNGFWHDVALWTLWAAVALTVATGLDYARSAWQAWGAAAPPATAS